MEYRECKKHGLQQAYGKARKCRVCSIVYTVNRQRKLKSEMIKLHGGKCTVCGYNKCDAALQFHHLDKSKKSFSIGENRTISLARMTEECRKCILVCANCHAEIEAGLLKDSNEGNN